MGTAVVRKGLKLSRILINNFLTLTGEDTLIAYTISDGTYLIFGGMLKYLFGVLI